ncbi:Uncharacterized protein Fot_00267 [Forsythia ovata]|uniref:Uncharacterized protein n=1 Tax=Forsythia ovata TaxID=205694 RepID=A0ABD1X3S4_9LAMI
MKKQGSSSLPKIGLVGLAAKKIPPVRGKTTNQEHKKTGKKGDKRDAIPEVGGSSKRSLKDEDNLEILKEEGLSRKATKPRTASSKSPQNQSMEGVGTSNVQGEANLPSQEGEMPDHFFHVKKSLERRPCDISPKVLGMLPNHLQRATATVDSFWTDSWAAYSAKSSVEAKLIAAKALAARSMVLIEEAEVSVRDLELNKRNVALRNVEKMIKDLDYFKELSSWLQVSLKESKKELRVVTDQRDKLKEDLQNAEFDVAEFSKRYDNAAQSQLVTSKALEEVNDHKRGLIEKVAELENALDSLKVENSGLKEEKLGLERNTEDAVKAGVENFRNQFEFTQDYENLQAFFVNFGARQVLAELKELHPSLDLSALKSEYPAPEEADEEADQPPPEA